MGLTKNLKSAQKSLQRTVGRSAPGTLMSVTTSGTTRRPLQKFIRQAVRSALNFAGEWNVYTQYKIGDIVIMGSNNYTGDDEETGQPLGTDGYQEILEEGFQAGTYLCFATPPIGTTPFAQPSRHWYMLARATWPLLCVRDGEITNKIGMEANNTIVQFLMWFGSQVLELNPAHAQIGDNKFSLKLRKQEYCKDDKTYYQFVLATKLIDPDTMEEVDAIDES